MEKKTVIYTEEKPEERLSFISENVRVYDGSEE